MVGKEEAAAKMFANLSQGVLYTWPTSKGDITCAYGGNARTESLDGCWSGKIVEHLKIYAELFAERDTISGSKTFKYFRVPKGKALHAIVVEHSGNGKELRIVTQQSRGNVAKIHNRMPLFIDI